MTFATRGCFLAMTLALFGAVPTSAASPEAAAGGAAHAMLQAFGARFERGAAVESVMGAIGFQGDPVQAPVKPHLVISEGQKASAVKPPVKEIDLPAQLNRHLKTTLTYTLGGKSVWVSGAFDRAEAAYVSVLEDGKPARFYNVEGLLTKPGMLDIGTLKYKLSLSPDLTDTLESEIVLTNTANRKDQQRITLREMLAAVSEQAADAAVGGINYRMFYYDDLKDNAQDPTTKSFVFIHTDDKGQNSVFLIPAETVPSDKIATFKMLQNKVVGLQQVKGKLRIFDNP